MSEPAREPALSTSPEAGTGVPEPGARSWGAGKLPPMLSLAGLILLADFATKQLVLQNFRPYQQVEVISDYVRLTFIENAGAAFGIHVGPYNRIVFMVLTVIALVALATMFRATPARDRLRLTAITLISAGAAGNLIDRIRSARGVVDFIDVGVGNLRWPIFNVADMAITTGAILLALSLWGEERRPSDRRNAPRGAPGEDDRRADRRAS